MAFNFSVREFNKRLKRDYITSASAEDFSVREFNKRLKLKSLESIPFKISSRASISSMLMDFAPRELTNTSTQERLESNSHL